ncbi:hypothetical protein Tco_1520692, partial [Tanacetum coccineum]
LCAWLEEPEQVYVTEPEYPEYLVPSDAEAPMEDQPLPMDASPRALSPGYIADSESGEEQEALDDDDEDEEHLASTDSSVAPIDDHVLSDEETEPFEEGETAATPSPPRLSRARIFVRPYTPLSPSIEACITEYAVVPTIDSPTYVKAPLGYIAA